MDSTLSSKLTLYDILAMLVPGALILIWINIVIGKCFFGDECQANNWTDSILYVSGSYIVGIVYCRFIEFIWNLLPFRNNENDIVSSLDDVASKIHNINYLPQKEESKENRIILDFYNEAYAFVSKNTYRNVIEVLESQFAFLRSMLPIVIIYFTLLVSCATKEKLQYVLGLTEDYENILVVIYVIGFLIVLILMLLSMRFIQHKIYNIVWEDYEYLSRINSKEQDSPKESK